MLGSAFLLLPVPIPAVQHPGIGLEAQAVVAGAPGTHSLQPSSTTAISHRTCPACALHVGWQGKAVMHQLSFGEGFNFFLFFLFCFP